MLEALVELASRLIAYLFVDILFVGVFYPPGWLVLRLLTWGRYPPAPDVEHNYEFVAVVALALTIAVLAMMFS